MLAGKPIGGHAKFFSHRLLEGKLTASAVSVRRNYILAVEVAAKPDARLCLECLLHHRVGIGPKVIRFVPDGNEQIVAHGNSPPVVLAVINFPFDSRRERGRIWSRLNVPEDIQTYFHTAPRAYYEARYK